MSRRYLAAALALCIPLARPAPARGQATDWRTIPKTPLRVFSPQEPRRIALPNGLVVFLQEDHELPLIQGSVQIRGGSREEPAAKVGLVSIFGQAWRTGGTRTRTGDELDDYLEARAAKVETSSGLDSTGISWDCLKGNFDEVFQVVTELLRSPEFREEKIVIAKNRINTGIARRNDDPAAIAAREGAKLGYGPRSPFARTAEYATVEAVTRDDLLAWHRTFVHPNNILLGISGDFDSQKMEGLLRRALGPWPRGPAAKKAEVAISEPRPGVYFVEKDDVNQSNIVMVHLGIARSDPDYYAVQVLNEVLGGGSASRLFSNIRSKKGLAYRVGGGVGSAFDHPGLFRLLMGTKSNTTASAIDALFDEVDNLLKNPVSADELKSAKETILNSFIFRVDSKAKVLSERLLYEYYGYPPDSLERYRAAIERVTGDDVARVARAHVHRDKIALLVVGKAADFDRPLSSFGVVTKLDITIPERTAEGARGGGP